MRLRKLELKDAPLMLEWMHDKSVVEDLRTNFLVKTMDDCENFIRSSWNDDKNWNFGIVDEADNYMGTVSLKNITEKSAEFGITIRACAMGKGYSIQAMREALRIAFEEKGLDQVYWCVSPNNLRAVHFYDKNGFFRAEVNKLDMIKGYTMREISSYIWYLERKTR